MDGSGISQGRFWQPEISLRGGGSGRALFPIFLCRHGRCNSLQAVPVGAQDARYLPHLAAALRDNGGGRVISTEFEPTKVARARANLSAAGLDDLVEIRVGDAPGDTRPGSSRRDRSGAARRSKKPLPDNSLPSRAAAQVWFPGAGRQRGLEPGLSCPHTGRSRRLRVRSFLQ